MSDSPFRSRRIRPVNRIHETDPRPKPGVRRRFPWFEVGVVAFVVLLTGLGIWAAALGMEMSEVDRKVDYIDTSVVDTKRSIADLESQIRELQRSVYPQEQPLIHPEQAPTPTPPSINPEGTTG